MPSVVVTRCEWLHHPCTASGLNAPSLARLTESACSIRPTLDRFTSENSQNLEFTRELWLSPIFSLHHLKPFEVHDLRDFERKRLAELGHSDGIRYCDIFQAYAPAFLSTALALYESQTLPDVNLVRRDWTSWGASQIYYPPDFATLRQVPYDVHLCEALCNDDRGCLTWLWEDDRINPPRCSLSMKHVKMGSPAKNVVSGWRLDRISKMRKDLDCNNMVTRKLADLERFGPQGKKLKPWNQLTEDDQKRFKASLAPGVEAPQWVSRDYSTPRRTSEV